MPKRGLVSLILTVAALRLILAYTPKRFVPLTMQYSVDSTRGLNLPAPQQKAFVEAFKTAEFSVAALSGATFDEKVAVDPEKFDALRAAYPDLAPLTDAKITAVINSYVATKVTPVEAFFGTPVGPRSTTQRWQQVQHPMSVCACHRA